MKILFLITAKFKTTPHLPNPKIIKNHIPGIDIFNIQCTCRSILQAENFAVQIILNQFSIKKRKKDKPVIKLKRTFKCQLMFSKQSVKLTQDNCAACFYYLLCHLLFLIANIAGIKVYSILWIFWTCVSLQVLLIVDSFTKLLCVADTVILLIFALCLSLQNIFAHENFLL